MNNKINDQKLSKRVVLPTDNINYIGTFQDVKELCRTQLSKSGKSVPSDKTLRYHIAQAYDPGNIVYNLEAGHLDLLLAEKKK